MSSFVTNKSAHPWLWSAMGTPPCRESVFHVGDRRHKNASRLWTTIPPMYRADATCHTTLYVMSKHVCPCHYTLTRATA
jgi:hypothetical protein